MTKTWRAVALCALLLMLWEPGRVCAQQQKSSALAAPIPSLILTAKKIFISNEGGDINTNLGDAGAYGETPTDAYNEFYAAVKKWGKYELASTPEDADLIFAIRFTVPIAEPGRRGNPAWADPQVRLVIIDPKAHVTLWGFTEHVATATLQSNRDKNLKAAVNKTVEDLQLLLSPQ